ncbi:hypothetical protein PYK22_02277 [Pyrinomonas methylaliphatogenes]|uniref:Uncharacterized protein n=1 Tax=Pyrinomonas methylaliphatogenes TaxID=454194 RepID=A0A0B6WZV7_9BACT|nr:hypothetical protein PYK22_02277 [Pyrinomonas methylaliphatogenes]
MKDRLRRIAKGIPLIGKAYVQRDELRAIVNQLWELPGHFYSPIPSIEEVRKYERDSSMLSRENSAASI